MYVFIRLELDRESMCDFYILFFILKFGSVFDIGKVFKGKTDKK